MTDTIASIPHGDDSPGTTPRIASLVQCIKAPRRAGLHASRVVCGSSGRDRAHLMVATT